MSSGILDLGASNSITFAQVATITGGTVQGGTMTALGGYALEAGTVSAALAGNVPLTKSTGGIATLSGSNTYTGTTTVNGGTRPDAGSAGRSAVDARRPAGHDHEGVAGLAGGVREGKMP